VRVVAAGSTAILTLSCWSRPLRLGEIFRRVCIQAFGSPGRSLFGSPVTLRRGDEILPPSSVPPRCRFNPQPPSGATVTSRKRSRTLRSPGINPQPPRRVAATGQRHDLRAVLRVLIPSHPEGRLRRSFCACFCPRQPCPLPECVALGPCPGTRARANPVRVVFALEVRDVRLYSRLIPPAAR
jgi:hypothetical protein